MANSKTAKQRIRTNERSRQRNIAVKSRVKSFVKTAETTLTSGDAAASEPAFRSAIAEIDRAMSKGIIHANTGARKKSSLARQFTSAAKK